MRFDGAKTSNEGYLLMAIVLIISFFFYSICFSQGKNEARLNELIKKLKDGNTDVRIEAAKALEEMKDVRAVKPLIEALKKDENKSVRQSAVWALRELKDGRAVEPLIETLKKDEDAIVRQFAAEAL